MSTVDDRLRKAMREYHADGDKLAVLVIDEQSGQEPGIIANAQEDVLLTAVELNLPVWHIELNPGMHTGKTNKPTDRHLGVAGARICTKPHLNAFVVKAHPNLHEELKKDRITMLVVMGFAANCCVKATAVGGSDSPPPKGAAFDPAKTPRLFRAGATQLGYIVLTSDLILRPEPANWKNEPGVRFYTQV
jgi:hypothetical protein